MASSNICYLKIVFFFGIYSCLLGAWPHKSCRHFVGLHSQLFASINTFSKNSHHRSLLISLMLCEGERGRGWRCREMRGSMSTRPTPFYMLQNNFQSHILCHQRHLSFMRKMFGNFAPTNIERTPSFTPPLYPCACLDSSW